MSLRCEARRPEVSGYYWVIGGGHSAFLAQLMIHLNYIDLISANPLQFHLDQLYSHIFISIF